MSRMHQAIAVVGGVVFGWVLFGLVLLVLAGTR